MKNNASIVYSFFLVIGDFLALVAAFIGAYALRSLDKTPVAHPVHAVTFIELFVFLVPFWLIIFGLLGLYNRNIYEKRFSEGGRLFIGSFVGMLFVIAFNYALVKPILPAKLVPVYGFILAFIFLVIFRNLARWLRTVLFSYEIGINNVLIIGDTSIAEELVGSLRNSKQSGYRVIGFVGGSHFAQKHLAGIKQFASATEAFEHFKSSQIDSIIQTELYSQSEKNNQILNFAQKHHISYRFVPGNTELFVGNIEVDLFRSSVPVIAVHQTPLVGWGRIVKRLFDLVTSFLLLVITSPILLLIILIQAIFGHGPIFFRQKRLTRFGNEVNILKFRTLKPEYNGKDPIKVFQEMNRPDLIEEYQNNRAKVANDPRISQLGQFLRDTSLDELPQLFNVLKGSISLVGPRAIPGEELAAFKDKGAMILNVKTGITGIAQVSGRSDLSIDERIRLDLYYVQNWSFWLDVTILLKTIRVIFSGEGAK